MSQHFLGSGAVVPVTVLSATPMVVTQVKSKDGKDGYNAVQFGLAKKVTGTKHQTKAVAGHAKNAKLAAFAEVREKEVPALELGQEVGVEQFAIGELVDVQGVMKGRGFTGAVKRHGFAGFPASHGHDKPRQVGSIGQRFPQHVRKGLRGPGHMGDHNVTVKNLQVVAVDTQKHLIMLKGAVPGSTGQAVRIVSTGVVRPLEVVVEVKEDKKKK